MTAVPPRQGPAVASVRASCRCEVSTPINVRGVLVCSRCEQPFCVGALAASNDVPLSVKNPPHGKTSRWMREHLRRLPGAYRIGKTWFISPEDFARAATTARVQPRSTAASGPLTDEDAAAADLAAVLRPTRARRA